MRVSQVSNSSITNIILAIAKYAKMQCLPLSVFDIKASIIIIIITYNTRLICCLNFPPKYSFTGIINSE